MRIQPWPLQPSRDERFQMFKDELVLFRLKRCSMMAVKKNFNRPMRTLRAVPVIAEAHAHDVVGILCPRSSAAVVAEWLRRWT